MDHFGRMGLSEAQADLLEVATNFCREKSPIEKVRALIDDDKGYDEAVWAEMASLGWLGVAVPEAYGGAGLELAEVAPIMEQMGRRLLASPFYSTTLAARALVTGGTEAQKISLLPKIVDGAAAAIALSEGESDWAFTGLEARASASEGGYKLSGQKFFVTDAAAAELIIASVALEGAPALVVIEKKQLPEGALRREIVIDETRRSYALSLDGISVPEGALLDPSRAEETLKHLHLAANLLMAAEMCGGTQSAIDYTIEYLTTRKQFGKLIGSYQGLKHPTVNAYVHYEQARSHLYAAAHCFNEQGTGEIATRMAKAEADVAFSHAGDRAIQFHGGFGFTYDCDAQLYRRRAMWCSSQFGDAAYHRRQLADLILPSL